VTQATHRTPPHALLGTMLIALLHGLIYLFLLPPWQHYDEPGHMEYVWLIAHEQRLPQPGDVNRDMRFDFVESMARHNFYRDLGGPPVLDRAAGPVPEIGLSQLDDSPLYYAAAAVFTLPFRSAPIETQLYAARSFSLLLLLVAVTCGWGIARELTGADHPLRWMLPFSMAMLPPFVDLMTAVNNDTGAIAAYSFFLWGSTRLIQRNTGTRARASSARQAVWVFSAALVCLFTKASAASAVVMALLALLFGLTPPKWRRWAWGILGGALVAGLLLAFRWGDAAIWYRTYTVSRLPLTRCDTTTCPGGVVLGGHAIRVSATTDNGRIIQALPPEITVQLRGQTVTIAGWATSAKGDVNTQIPWISPDYAWTGGQGRRVSEKAGFFAVTQRIPDNAEYARIVMPATGGADMLYDGLIIIKGDIPSGEPQFEDVNAARVSWGGVTHENLARNASFENATVSIQPAALALLDRVTPAWMEWALGLSALLDLRGTGWYFARVAQHMFESFWGRFAWGHVAMPSWAFVVLGVMSAICGLRSLRFVGRVRPELLILSGAALLATIVPAVLRAIGSALEFNLWLPSARYVFPAVCVCLLPVAAGLSELGRLSLLPKLIWTAIAATGILVVLLHYWI
jgi:Predicted membrane protein (DUF2142)